MDITKMSTKEIQDYLNGQLDDKVNSIVDIIDGDPIVFSALLKRFKYYNKFGVSANTKSGAYSIVKFVLGTKFNDKNITDGVKYQVNPQGQLEVDDWKPSTSNDKEKTISEMIDGNDDIDPSISAMLDGFNSASKQRTPNLDI